MKYNRNLKIELILDDNPYDDYRTVYYRIVPSELPFLKRLFCNDTRQVFHSYKYYAGKSYLFGKKEFYWLVKNVKTFGDMCDYLRKEQEIIDRNNAMKKKETQKLIAEEKVWPDVDSIDEL